MVEGYCVRRILNNGAREHIKYFTGDERNMDQFSDWNDWCDWPDDINITVLDAMGASQTKEYIEKIVVRDSSIRYDVAPLDRLNSISTHIDTLISL